MSVSNYYPVHIIFRVGQVIVTTLSHRDKGDENEIDVYADSPPLPPSLTSPDRGGEKREGGEEREGGDVMEGGKERERRWRDIVVRNMMLDMVLSLLSSTHMELNSKYTHINYLVH